MRHGGSLVEGFGPGLVFQHTIPPLQSPTKPNGLLACAVSHSREGSFIQPRILSPGFASTP